MEMLSIEKELQGNTEALLYRRTDCKRMMYKEKRGGHNHH